MCIRDRYEMVMLRRPFQHENPTVVFDMIVNREFEPLPEDVDPFIRSLVTQMLQKDPENRPDIWDIAKLDVIQERIKRFADDQNCRTVVNAVFDELPRSSKPALSADNSLKPNMKVEEEKYDAGVRNGNAVLSSQKIFDIAREIQESIPKKSEKIGLFKKVDNAFGGEDLIGWFRAHYPQATNDQVLEFCEEMLKLNLLQSPTDRSKFNKSTVYRFAVDSPTTASNMFKIFAGQARDASTVACDLVLKLNEVLAETRVEINGKLSLSANKVKESKAFKKYQEISYELQKVKLANLSQKEYMAFFLNIYQLMYTHECINSILNSKSDNKGLISKLSTIFKGFNASSFVYYIDGNNYTLDEVQHGILRNNRKSPKSYFRSLAATDPRASFLRVNDPRIICTFIEDGVLPQKLEPYEPKYVEERLDVITREFIMNCVEFNFIQDEISLPKLFYVYKDDLGKTPQEIATWLFKYANVQDEADVLEGVKAGRIKLVFDDR
eukprot:TRINITY_DN752_c0_g1_i14.p1 TRINITY_DN752_c0_g1~~TRINITY_DN752_c0_g1_i14.p1  ORF type:complete len:532 (+),score=111.68 TRINITY_DN752_c0_g1_i14:114-1598(+)